jgi:hypothetical protein
MQSDKFQLAKKLHRISSRFYFSPRKSENISTLKFKLLRNGSIRTETLLELMKASKNNFTAREIRIAKKGQKRNIKEVWKLFDIIHRSVTTEKALRRITREMIEGILLLFEEYRNLKQLKTLQQLRTCCECLFCVKMACSIILTICLAKTL